jgi:hypothetical protein
MLAAAPESIRMKQAELESVQRRIANFVDFGAIVECCGSTAHDQAAFPFRPFPFRPFPFRPFPFRPLPLISRS